MFMTTMEIENDTPRSNTIKPTSFYSRENEKTKFNWFSYELSRGVYDAVKNTTGNLLKRYKIGDEELASFSIDFSKKMQNIILQKLAGNIDTIYISYEMVEFYFPDITEKQVNKILTAISEAWDELLSICETCSTRCISEKDLYCTMFDEESLYGD